MQAPREPEGRRPVRLLLQRDQGLGAYAAGKAKTISGIKTPNASTIVFNLTAPTGDFLYRMGMPATGPQPAEVTKCFEGQPGKYGHDLDLDGRLHDPGHRQGRHLVDCSKLKPASGFDGQTQHDRSSATRTTTRRPTRPRPAQNYCRTSSSSSIDANADDIYNKIDAGDLRRRGLEHPAAGAARSTRRPRASSRLHQNSGDRTWYLTMNLTQPPFDDIHVRQAMNWIMDKAALGAGLGRADDRRHR